MKAHTLPSKPLPLPSASPSPSGTERLRRMVLMLLLPPVLRACAGSAEPGFAEAGAGQGARYWGKPILVVSSSSGSSPWARKAAMASRSEGLRFRQPQVWPPSSLLAPPASSSTVIKVSPHKLSQRSRPCWYIWNGSKHTYSITWLFSGHDETVHDHSCLYNHAETG